MAKLTLHTPWTNQPQTPVDIDPRWLARGLTFLNLGNGRYWQKNKGWMGTGTIAGTPKNVAGKMGVSKGFGATLGTGTTDRIDAGYVPIQQAPYRSIVAHIYANSSGGGGLGRVFQDVSGTGLTAGDDNVWFQTGGIYMAYTRRASGTNGQWTPTIAQPLGRWSSFGVSHDQTSIGSSPVLYVDGISGAISTATSTSGTYTAVGTTLSWGNRSSDSARNWDGLLGPTAFFDCLLTAQEHVSLSANIWQLLKPLQRTIWVPATGGGGTIYTMTPGGTITFTGTVLQRREHVQPISGSIAFSGTVAQRLTRAFSPSGSISFSGTNTLLRTRLFTPSGNITFSGTAPFSQNNTYTLSPGGIITFSGTGGQVRERVQIATGNITFSGAVDLLRTRTMVPTGDIVFSGSATETRIRVIAPTGQITFTGTAPLINPDAVGGVTTWRTLTGMGN